MCEDLTTDPLFGLDAVFRSRDALKQAAQRKAAEDGTKLRVYISQPGRVDRARIYLGCPANGTRAGATQCTYRLHATEYNDKWQVTKADFEHTHDHETVASRASTGPNITVGQEFPSQDAFIRCSQQRGAADNVDLRIFVNLGKLARRARFAMCCAYGSKANAAKTKRCTYSFIAIDYEGQWQITQCCFEHSHDALNIGSQCGEDSVAPKPSPAILEDFDTPTPDTYSPVSEERKHMSDFSSRTPEHALSDSQNAFPRRVSDSDTADSSFLRAIPQGTSSYAASQRTPDTDSDVQSSLIEATTDVITETDGTIDMDLQDDVFEPRLAEDAQIPRIVRSRAPTLQDLLQ